MIFSKRGPIHQLINLFLFSVFTKAQLRSMLSRLFKCLSDHPAPTAAIEDPENPTDDEDRAADNDEAHPDEGGFMNALEVQPPRPEVSNN